MNKVNKYLDLKNKYNELLKQPIGNRIKQGGLLERKIKEQFSKVRTEEILKRTNEYNFEEYENIKNRYYKLKNELEEAGIITYNEEGDEIIHTE